MNIRYCLYLLTLMFGLLMSAQAQLVVEKHLMGYKPELYKHALIADAENQSLHLIELLSGTTKLDFRPVSGPNENLGFTNHHYWVHFAIQNKTDEQLTYYLETARPITDYVELHTLTQRDELSTQYSGDAIADSERSFNHRKTIFKIKIKPGETNRYYMHLKSDGEVINLPLNLQTDDEFVQQTYLEQIVFGFFYGILLLACITYLFFYRALKERVFLYYSVYVFFIFLLQFTLDGFVHQYFASHGGSLYLKSVVLFAAFGGIFLGKYGESFLGIKKHFRALYLGFNFLYISQALILIWILFSPEVPVLSYPLANTSGLLVLSLLLVSILGMYIKKIKVDIFFAIGIGFLVLGFVIFILNNFSLIPNSFITANSSKLGTGMEVIFLSLSMANRIRLLKNEKEQMQNLALKKSEDMNELKSYFMSNMSHELRTPLNAIMGITDMMLKEKLDDRLLKQFEVIKYSSVSLLSSVNDIFDFGKIEKGELKLDSVKFEPAEVLLQIKNNAEKQARDKGLDFHFAIEGELPACIIGDPVRLGQMVNNVLSNAVKFTSSGWVSFKVSALNNESGKTNLTLTISDSGVGIPANKREEVFEAFMQESINNKRKFGGLGLGLSIVKKLVDLHQGIIKLDSEPGYGTVCTLFLPYDTAPYEPQTPSGFSESVYNLKGNRVLIVEDNAINQLLLKTMLSKWEETKFDIASNGEEALEWMNKQTYQMVLMDLQMPIMDGYETTIAIREGKAGHHHRHVPIIAVTADTMEGTKYKVREIGMNEYLTKPINQKVLYQTITQLLSTSHQPSPLKVVHAA